jgi:hypothetical protein
VRSFQSPGPVAGSLSPQGFVLLLAQNLVFLQRFPEVHNISHGNLTNYVSRQNAKTAKGKGVTILSSWRSWRLGERTGLGCGRRARWVWRVADTDGEKAKTRTNGLPFDHGGQRHRVAASRCPARPSVGPANTRSPDPRRYPESNKFAPCRPHPTARFTRILLDRRPRRMYGNSATE